MVQLEDELLTVAEAAASLKVTRHTIYRWIAEGRLPAVRYSRRVVRLRREDLEALGEGNAGKRAEQPAPSWKKRLAPFMGIITKEEGELLRRVIMEDRRASMNDPG